MSDNFNPPNSIWPNGIKKDDENYIIFYPLGTNKVTVPASKWPKGDKYISPFVYENEKLVGFIDSASLTLDEPLTIYFPYEYIDVKFPNIEKGILQIHAPKATTKKVSWSDGVVEDIPEVQFKYKGCKTVNEVKAIDADYKINDIVDGVWSEPLWDLENGYWMFMSCYDIASFSSDLPNLTSGRYMFNGCSKLTSFSSSLSSLSDGESMFGGCSKLTTFSSGLPSLTYGTSMFSSCNGLTTFNVPLSSLMRAYQMFMHCTNLTTFSSDLSSLTYSDSMFHGCSKLTSFSSDLSSLTDGSNMFNKCVLDAPSVKNIIDTINSYSGALHIGMGCNNTTEDTDFFAQEVGYTDMTSLLASLQAKGWTVTAQYNGRPKTTYGLRRPSENTLPVFVKLEETEDHADYTSEDGSKKFRLDWFHETTGSTDGFTQFNSLEEAVEHFNIRPIERN